jgi:hypothetical protein
LFAQDYRRNGITARTTAKQRLGFVVEKGLGVWVMCRVSGSFASLRMTAKTTATATARTTATATARTTATATARTTATATVRTIATAKCGGSSPSLRSGSE